MYKPNLINALTLKFLLLITINLFLVVDSATILNQGKVSKHPKLVIFSYDGFRFDYMNKTDTPTLDRLKSQGVTSPYMKSQFTTKTFPNHQTIATGLHTENHGIMDNQVFDPLHGVLLSGYESYNVPFWHFRDDVSPVWMHNEWAEDSRFSGASWPGSNHPYGENKTTPAHFLTYNKSLSFEDRVEYVIEWLTDEEKPANLVFMYFDEPDGKGHGFGPESPEVIQEIKRMDTVTELLLTRLKEEGIDEEVNIIILSDHGFQEVSLRTMINITSIVDLNLIEDPYVGTPLTQFRPKEGKLDEVYQALKVGSQQYNYSVYKKEELPLEWHFGDNRRIMPIVVLADLGFVFDDFADRTRKRNAENNITADIDTKYGAHGYDNNAESMRSFFLAYGPAFKKGVQISPFENVDLYPLICDIMNIAPSPNNGTLAIVRDSLISTKSNAGFSMLKSQNSLSSVFQFGIYVLLSYTFTSRIGS